MHICILSKTNDHNYRQAKGPQGYLGRGGKGGGKEIFGEIDVFSSKDQGFLFFFFLFSFLFFSFLFFSFFFFSFLFFFSFIFNLLFLTIGFKSAAKAPKLFGNTEQHQSFFETGADDEMEDKEEQEELKKMKDKKAMKKKKHADLAGEDAVSEGVMKKKEEMVGYGEDDEAMEGDDEEEEEGPVAVAEEDEEKENFKDMLDTNFLRSYKFYRSGEEEGLRFVLSFPASAPKILMLDLIEREVKKCVVKCIPGITKCFITEYTVPGTSNKVFFFFSISFFMMTIIGAHSLLFLGPRHPN